MAPRQVTIAIVPSSLLNTNYPSVTQSPIEMQPTPSPQLSHLTLPQFLIPPHRQKRQTPQLPHIALRRILARGRRQRAQRRETEISIAVHPAPDFGAEVLGVGLEGVPEVVVGCEDVGVDGGVGAEVGDR